jgi:hypothetical protein
MANQNITIIPQPRVPIVDENTGYVTREWYRYFTNLFVLTGAGSSPTTIPDLQTEIDDAVQQALDAAALTGLAPLVEPPAQNLIGNNPNAELLSAQIAELEKQIQALKLAVQPELGTLASVNEDNVRRLVFNPNPSPEVVYTPATLAWNTDDGTLDVGLNNDVVLQVGQESLFYAKNTSGGSIAMGSACMFTGVIGTSGKLTFAKAISDGSLPYEYMMGIIAQDAGNNDFAYVTNFGLVRGFDTTGSTKTVPETWASGDLLYFDPAYPGELTKVEPEAPAFNSPIAVVVNAASGGAGSIFVRMKTGESLNNLHDVRINGTGPAAGQILIYDATQQRWENNLLTEGANIEVTNADGAITIATTGASGSFTAQSGETITVVDGVITSIV